MADCANCGESFVHLKPGALCPDCRPPDSEPADAALLTAGDTEEEESPPASKAYPPLGVAILSVWNYFGAAVALLLGIVFMISPSVITAHGNLDSDLGKFGIALRLTAFTVAAFFSVLSYEVGKALWKLRNWARWFMLVVSGIDLIAGGPASQVVGRVISLIVICYLLAPSVRAAFYAHSETPQAA